MTALAGEDVKGNTHSLLVGVQTCTDTIEIGIVVPQEAEHLSYLQMQLPFSWTYTQTSQHPITEPLAQPGSLLLYHHSQQEHR